MTSPEELSHSSVASHDYRGLQVIHSLSTDGSYCCAAAPLLHIVTGKYYFPHTPTDCCTHFDNCRRAKTTTSATITIWLVITSTNSEMTDKRLAVSVFKTYFIHYDEWTPVTGVLFGDNNRCVLSIYHCGPAWMGWWLVGSSLGRISSDSGGGDQNVSVWFTHHVPSSSLPRPIVIIMCIIRLQAWCHNNRIHHEC